ncbi:GNAT family N-acetyltransferase [Sagittula stellata]|uniref:Acetyltransferase n=1 Tax=Sagittula stellata (strain ATCC 700073 / DSM 11524 / E-37) TaxID=388399 RepID=A3K854_SAGS3|nr:GNAT family N-acetyltransferase [Sagittula stellata]EBA06533.1 acetyltransferase [Sagittula stellata E-37]
MTLEIVKISEKDRYARALGRVLADSVTDGAAISFMQPFTVEEGARWFETAVFPDVTAGGRVLFGALVGGHVVGTVQLLIAMPPNQAHRAEIAKMIVHPDSRRQGIGRALMQAALDEARARQKTLVTLDTRTGDRAEPLYASVGFEVAGVIPDFASDPDGAALHPTTYMYMSL